jgi:hypothetical protein
MIDQTLEGRRAFILENTRVQAPPHAPELSLHLADEITPIWKLTEEALVEIGLPPPFWAFAWAGGQALARYILDHPEIVAGKTVVDFATGSGLVAIAAMKAGAKRAGQRHRQLLPGGGRPERRGQRRRDRLHRPQPAGRPAARGRRAAGRRHLLRKADGRGGDGLAAPGPAAGASGADRRSGPHLFPQGRPGEAGRIPGRDHPRAGRHGVKRTCVWTLP